MVIYGDLKGFNGDLIVMDIVEPGFFDFDLGVSHCF
jgi:hypothetical protein